MVYRSAATAVSSVSIVCPSVAVYACTDSIGGIRSQSMSTMWMDWFIRAPPPSSFWVPCQESL